MKHHIDKPIDSTAAPLPFWRRAVALYVEGFKSMSKTSKTLWLIILIKLFIMFAVLRLFFFPDIIKQQGNRDKQQQFVVEQFTRP